MMSSEAYDTYFSEGTLEIAFGVNRRSLEPFLANEIQPYELIAAYF